MKNGANSRIKRIESQINQYVTDAGIKPNTFLIREIGGGVLFIKERREISNVLEQSLHLKYFQNLVSHLFLVFDIYRAKKILSTK